MIENRECDETSRSDRFEVEARFETIGRSRNGFDGTCSSVIASLRARSITRDYGGNKEFSRRNRSAINLAPRAFTGLTFTAVTDVFQLIIVILEKCNLNRREASASKCRVIFLEHDVGNPHSVILTVSETWDVGGGEETLFMQSRDVKWVGEGRGRSVNEVFKERR